jgi:hypothetical protein
MHVIEYLNSNLFQVFFKEMEENRLIPTIFEQPFALFEISMNG